MVVGADGAQLGVLPIDKALEEAEEAELDLVEVSPNTSPPVCKIMDFGKYKYRQSKKAHDAKKRQKIIRVKEVKVTPNTEKHDFDFKVNHAKRFLADGAKVKVSVFFRGRQMAHTELGLKILERFIADIADEAILEQEPTQDRRSMTIILAPPPEDKKSAKKKEAQENAGDDNE